MTWISGIDKSNPIRMFGLENGSVKSGYLEFSDSQEDGRRFDTTFSSNQPLTWDHQIECSAKFGRIRNHRKQKHVIHCWKVTRMKNVLPLRFLTEIICLNWNHLHWVFYVFPILSVEINLRSCWFQMKCNVNCLKFMVFLE